MMTNELADFSKKIAYAQMEGSGIQGLSRILMQEIEKTVIITDIFGEVVSWHSPSEQEMLSEEKLTLPSTAKNSPGTPKHGIIVIKGKKFNSLIWPINEKQSMGYLIVVSKNIKDNHKIFVDFTCLATAIEMVRQQELSESIQIYKDDFIHDILFNNYDGFDTAVRAGRTWGWDFTIPHVVIVLELVDEVRKMKELRRKIENKLTSKFPSMIIGKMGELLVLLYPISESIKGDWKLKVNQLYERIENEFEEVQFSMGVGKLYQDTSMLYRSYQQSKIALELGKISKYKEAAFFDELGAIRLFYNQSEQELEEFIDEILGPIMTYDEEKEGNLFITLWHYFQASSNVTAASKNLYVHVNTLRYRLTRAEELLGKSLEDEETRFNVYSALKIAAMLGKI